MIIIRRQHSTVCSLNEAANRWVSWNRERDSRIEQKLEMIDS
ncbi:hypothetical protein [Apibacter sp. B2912]|nr:hypothetical protein [Apibacter sp. B2912]